LAAALAFACFCAACLFLVFGDLSPMPMTFADLGVIASATKGWADHRSFPRSPSCTWEWHRSRQLYCLSGVERRTVRRGPKRSFEDKAPNNPEGIALPRSFGRE
jgi:hypothetical protein